MLDKVLIGILRLISMIIDSNLIDLIESELENVSRTITARSIPRSIF